MLDSPGRFGRAHAARRQLTRRLTKALVNLGVAEDATRVRLATKLIGRADRLLDRAGALFARATSAGVITPACAAFVGDVLADARSCVDALPVP